MSEEVDFVAIYGRSLGMQVAIRTILVEGVTDVDLFELAARLEYHQSGIQLLDGNLAIVAGGLGEQGGTNGVIREIISLRNFARTLLKPNGAPKYRFMGLFDNDHAGRAAVKRIREVDSSILEFKDVFRLWPIMPLPGNLDPRIVQNGFERENKDYAGLDWELEDILSPDFVEDFLTDFPDAVRCDKHISGKVHREFTQDGKARLHRYVRDYAVHADLCGVIELLKALRYYMGLKEATKG